jgi:hypothetical protein
MSRTLYFHIGISKTGSTFLRKTVFPQIDGLDVYIKPMADVIGKTNPYDGTFRAFFEASPHVWPDRGPVLFEKVFGPRDEQRARTRDVLVTDENVGHFMEPVAAREHVARFADVAAQWHFDDVRILVSVRNQATLFASDYAQMSDQRPEASQEHFEAYVRKRIDPSQHYHSYGVRFDYDLLYRSLTDAVGAKNVLLRPYEEMKGDQDGFLARWFSFLGIPDEGAAIRSRLARRQPDRQNVRSTSTDTWKLASLRSWNVELPAQALLESVGAPATLPLGRLDWTRPREIRLTDELRREVAGVYADSNRALADAIDTDLSPYGYYPTNADPAETRGDERPRNA